MAKIENTSYTAYGEATLTWELPDKVLTDEVYKEMFPLIWVSTLRALELTIQRDHPGLLPENSYILDK